MSTERNMKNENFVTFEVAKLLQGKGYREDCHASYRTDETGRSELTVVFGGEGVPLSFKTCGRIPVRIPGSHAIRRAKMGPYKRKDSHRCRAQQTRLECVQERWTCRYRT